MRRVQCDWECNCAGRDGEDLMVLMTMMIVMMIWMMATVSLMVMVTMTVILSCAYACGHVVADVNDCRGCYSLS